MWRPPVYRVLLTFPFWKLHGLNLGQSESVRLHLHLLVLFRRFHYRSYASMATEMSSFTRYKWFSWQYCG